MRSFSLGSSNGHERGIDEGKALWYPLLISWPCCLKYNWGPFLSQLLPQHLHSRTDKGFSLGGTMYVWPWGQKLLFLALCIFLPSCSCRLSQRGAHNPTLPFPHNLFVARKTGRFLGKVVWSKSSLYGCRKKSRPVLPRNCLLGEGTGSEMWKWSQWHCCKPRALKWMASWPCNDNPPEQGHHLPEGPPSLPVQEGPWQVPLGIALSEHGRAPDCWLPAKLPRWEVSYTSFPGLQRPVAGAQISPVCDSGPRVTKLSSGDIFISLKQGHWAGILDATVGV